MRIVCPGCSAAYEVPDAHLEAGRVVRCARCGTDWAPLVDIPDAETPPPAPEPEALPTPGALRPAREMALGADDFAMPAPLRAPATSPSPAPVKPRLPLLGLAWGLSALVLFGAAAEAVIARDAVMRVWPPSTRAYAALGFAHAR